MISCESFHKFTLPEGSRHHEDVNPNSNTAVDFEVAGNPPVWMEVKNWEAPVIPASIREQQRVEFEAQIRSKTFWTAMAAKFLGTHHCLQIRCERPESPVALLLLECLRFPRGHATILTSILQREVSAHAELADCVAVVLPFDKLSSRVAGASAVPCALSSELSCRAPVPHCSVDRRRHGGAV